MGARETILQTIRSSKPASEELPLIDCAEIIEYDNMVVQFIKLLTGIGGKVVYLDSLQQLLKDIQTEEENGRWIITRLGLEENDEFNSWEVPDLDNLHKCYLRSHLGVAENGAVWLPENQMGNRLLPFVCQHLVVVLKPKDIVSTMHQAYGHVRMEDGFGVFIAGPSKTADIEQNLVIGAHGARSMTVYLIEDDLSTSIFDKLKF